MVRRVAEKKIVRENQHHAPQMIIGRPLNFIDLNDSYIFSCLTAILLQILQTLQALQMIAKISYARSCCLTRRSLKLDVQIMSDIFPKSLARLIFSGFN